VRAGVIGCGPHGRRVIDALEQLGHEVVGLVDQRPAALAAVGTAPGAERLAHADALWAMHPELVCITTNGPSHAKLAIAAMQAGIRRVLVEKPLACSVAECAAMLEQATASSTRLAVDQLRRHDPVYQWLRERIASGIWGRVCTMWMQRPGIGLGCNGTHSFDLVRFLTRCEAVRVTGWVDAPLGLNPRGAEFVDPGGLVVMELDGGARAVIAQPEDCAGPTSVEVELTGARVRVDERTGAVEVIERDLSVKPGPTQGVVYRDVPTPTGLPRDLGSMIRGVLVELTGDGPMQCDARHGLSAVEVLAAAYLSHKSRGPVSLPLSPEGRGLWLPVT